ncbi:MAG TPA: cation:dicarboxylase symporter family transporter [Tepidisphaeraceae bacterium]|nr:cation:dicarboxylase symporter family transporter [Tepidisphaeraceae bacterium]
MAQQRSRWSLIRHSDLVIRHSGYGHWDFVGHWDLVIGHSISVSPPPPATGCLANDAVSQRTLLRENRSIRLHCGWQRSGGFLEILRKPNSSIGKSARNWNGRPGRPDRGLRSSTPVDLVRNTKDALLMAFSTGSSTATMPVTYECLHKRVGLPIGFIAILLPVDRFLDRCRTAINVMGDMNVSCIWDGKTRKQN